MCGTSWNTEGGQQMADRAGKKRTRSAGALGTVWPPPPTCETPKPAPQRRLLLPLHMALPQMPKGFSLPKWASSASLNLCLSFTVLWLAHDALIVGKIFVWIFVLSHSVEFLYLLTWAFFISLHLVRRSLGQTSEAPTTSWAHTLAWWGGWMGMVPSTMFLVWGLSYLDIYHIHRINLIALIVWGSWFLLGCGVAVVNGTRQWLRGRCIVTGAGDESATG